MKFKEVLGRITGISCPVFGVSWKPPESERATARRVVTFLEDRRVLYAPDSQEVPAHCVHSVLEIRHHLTAVLQDLPEKSELTENVRAMRAACRKFLGTTGDDRSDLIVFGVSPGHWASWRFHDAIGQLRGVFGIHVAQVAAKYGLDVEDELASILPAQASEDDEKDRPKKLPKSRG
ncbi:MAG: hypothetical protein RBU36_17475 [Thermoanaerobaculia bacterium]|jgi:hypothetical protein|nr:hypothetical protein [Thermoanaerobaculia bacterium]